MPAHRAANGDSPARRRSRFHRGRIKTALRSLWPIRIIRRGFLRRGVPLVGTRGGGKGRLHDAGLFGKAPGEELGTVGKLGWRDGAAHGCPRHFPRHPRLIQPGFSPRPCARGAICGSAIGRLASECSGLSSASKRAACKPMPARSTADLEIRPGARLAPAPARYARKFRVHRPAPMRSPALPPPRLLALPLLRPHRVVGPGCRACRLRQHPRRLRRRSAGRDCRGPRHLINSRRRSNSATTRGLPDSSQRCVRRDDRRHSLRLSRSRVCALQTAMRVPTRP